MGSSVGKLWISAVEVIAGALRAGPGLQQGLLVTSGIRFSHMKPALTAVYGLSTQLMKRCRRLFRIVGLMEGFGANS